MIPVRLFYLNRRRILIRNILLASTFTLTSSYVYLTSNTTLTFESRSSRADSLPNLFDSAYFQIPIRVTKSLSTFLYIAADYKYFFRYHDSQSTPRYKELRSQLHSRSADRLTQLCKDQGGIYVKLGQYASTMTQTLPKEYLIKLSSLQDSAASSPFSEIKELLEKQLNFPLNAVFQDFDPVPIASASIAQVHRASILDTDPNWETSSLDSSPQEVEVAVKIQHTALEWQVPLDLRVFQFICSGVKTIFDGADLSWILESFRKNLEAEMDFTNEAQNNDRTRQNFEDDPSIKVPRIYWNLSTDKLIVMELVHGEKITNKEYIETNDIDINSLCEKLVEIFAKMMFVHGFVHCDPHPGNLLLYKKNDEKDFQIALLDHGLYRKLERKFVENLCELWRAFLFLDSNEIQRLVKQLNFEGFENVLSLIVMNKTMDRAISSRPQTQSKLSKEEKQKIREYIKSKDMKLRFLDFMDKLPRDFLFLMKINSLIRNITTELGGHIDQFLIYARYAIEGMIKIRLSKLEEKYSSETCVKMRCIKLFLVCESYMRYAIDRVYLKFVCCCIYVCKKLSIKDGS